jgi:hypothetical protein
MSRRAFDIIRSELLTSICIKFSTERFYCLSDRGWGGVGLSSLKEHMF